MCLRRSRTIFLSIIVALLMPAFASAQSCSISVSPQYGTNGQARTLSWSVGSYVGTLDISNIGRVVTTCYGTNNDQGCIVPPTSGSLGIAPSYSTTYAGSASYQSCGYDSEGFYNCSTAYTYCSDTAYVTPPANCTAPWGATVYHGSSVTAYQASTVPYGSSCISEARPCNNGTLSGSYQYQSCTVQAPPPASCSVSLSPNPKSYAGTATLSWSSTNAHNWVYINNVGYVGSSGSTSVAPYSTTDYSCVASGSGGSDGWHSAILYVNPPANCTAPWGATVNHGSSVTAYQASTVPYGSSCVSQTRSCSNGTLSGSYQYQSCTVQSPPPTATITASPTPISQGQCSTVSWSSTNATSCTGTNFSTGGATSGSVQVCPTQSTTYSCSCTGPGGTTQCAGSGALSVSCTQAWTCTGAGNQTITRTNTDCSTTSITTCISPNFCTNGSATCITPIADGTISIAPPVVRSGATTRVTWSSTNAASCSVTGSNGDSWSGLSGTQTTSPIAGKVTYTLRCDDGDVDTIQDDLIKSITAYTVTTWRER